MQELDLEGLFWRPEAPNRENSGRLRFDPTDGAILSLIETVSVQYHCWDKDTAH